MMLKKQFFVSFLWIVLILGFACKSSQHQPTSSDTSAPVDEALLAYLSTARSLHHEADLAEDAQEIEKAIHALERIVATVQPRKALEINEVLADTYARLGDLRSRLGHFEAAHRDVDQGVRMATEHTYFSGHLFEVRGLIEERHSKKLAEQGKKGDAAQARERAIKAYEQAIAEQNLVIQRQVQSKTSHSIQP